MEEIEILKKRVLMRAEHRGIKEMDIILGGYVRANLEEFGHAELEEIERFMEMNDQKLYQAILGNEEIESRFSDLLMRIRRHISIDR